MRISIDGAQSTGKTTLHLMLSKTLLGSRYIFIPEASREIAPMFGVRTAHDWPKLLTDEKRLKEFFDAEENWQLERQGAGDRWITDSSLYIIAAFKLFFGLAVDKTLLASNLYDLILYCATKDSALEKNGFRFLQGRDEVDSIYRGLISTFYRGAFFELPSGPGRMDVALDRIQQSEKF